MSEVGKHNDKLLLGGCLAAAATLVLGLERLLERSSLPTAQGNRVPASIPKRKPAYVPVKLNPQSAFASVPGPSPDPPEVVGKFWSGCLQGASELPTEGPGFQRMRLSRKRGFGHPKLTEVVREIAERTKREGYGDLLVGDLSQARGGPMIGGHRSHQSGLDADLWFATSRDFGARRLSLGERESLSAVDMVSRDGRSLTPAFGSAQRRLLEWAARDERVQRIFVNPRIKKALCQEPRYQRVYWMRKIRPAFGHNYHFHVRLACPAGDRRCFDQPETARFENGCDAELDSWFTADGRLKAPPPAKESPDFYVPRECLALLKAER